MQKVVGSSPIIRSQEPAGNGGFSRAAAPATARREAVSQVLVRIGEARCERSIRHVTPLCHELREDALTVVHEQPSASVMLDRIVPTGGCSVESTAIEAAQQETLVLWALKHDKCGSSENRPPATVVDGEAD